MEDLFKFLPLIAIVVAAIWKEARKNKAKQEATQQRTPSKPELADDAVPMPEAWGKLFGPEELLNPKPIATPAKAQQARPSFQQQKEEKLQQIESKQSFATNHHITSDDESIHSKSSPYNTPSDNEGDFTIHSAQDARRAIIWGEILQRKY